ncbi:MAG: serine/threonine-protein kinase [Elusimicrobiota bacterium]
MGQYPKIINNQYLIIREVGSGGFYTVYKAWDNMLHKIVAVKKIHKEYSNEPKYIHMFRKEAVDTAKLEHRNIVRVVNFTRDEEGGVYIIMDYVKGADLQYLINKCRRNSIKIPPEVALYMIAEVIKAFDYAHNARDELTNEPLNIVHRDVSPGNVMLYFDGRIKLTDFGIAKIREESSLRKNIKEDKLKVKISYMSPELAELRENIDPRSDLFSCGSLIYELLTGHKAFDAGSDVAIWQKVRKVDADFSRFEELDIPDILQNIIKKTLIKSPDKRYQSAAEMFVDIKRYLSKKGTTEKLQEQYKTFINKILSDEIKTLRKEMDEDSKNDFRLPFNMSA